MAAHPLRPPSSCRQSLVIDLLISIRRYRSLAFDFLPSNASGYDPRVDNRHHASTTRASSAESTAVTPVCGFGRPGKIRNAVPRYTRRVASELRKPREFAISLWKTQYSPLITHPPSVDSVSTDRHAPGRRALWIATAAPPFPISPRRPRSCEPLLRAVFEPGSYARAWPAC